MFVRITFPDKSEIAVQVSADNAFPDSLDEARRVAVRGFREALDIAHEGDADEPDLSGFEIGED